ncbi:hypothetical protein C8F01DRAFT_1262785 [Mycena amicta]|nr:hypothetical protein C8F01DRAFT_1262785 [Mycena amicta]
MKTFHTARKLLLPAPTCLGLGPFFQHALLVHRLKTSRALTRSSSHRFGATDTCASTLQVSGPAIPPCFYQRPQTLLETTTFFPSLTGSLSHLLLVAVASMATGTRYPSSDPASGPYSVGADRPFTALLLQRRHVSTGKWSTVVSSLSSAGR